MRKSGSRDSVTEKGVLNKERKEGAVEASKRADAVNLEKRKGEAAPIDS